MLALAKSVESKSKETSRVIKKHDKRGILNYGYGLTPEQENQYQIYGAPSPPALLPPPQQDPITPINEQHHIPDHSNDNHHHFIHQDHQNHFFIPQHIPPHVHPIRKYFTLFLFFFYLKINENFFQLLLQLLKYQLFNMLEFLIQLSCQKLSTLIGQ